MTSLASVKPVGPNNVLSMAQLRTLPLGDQVKTLMKNGRTAHLSTEASKHLVLLDWICWDTFHS